VPEDRAAIGPAALFVGSTCGRILAGAMSRWPRRRLLVVGTVTTVTGLIVVCSVASGDVALMGVALAGCGLGPLYPLAVTETLAGSTDPARTSARATSAIGSALLIAPFVIGTVIERVDQSIGFGLLVVLGVVALGLQRRLWIHEHDGPRRPSTCRALQPDSVACGDGL
jgi:fucose permease